MVLIAQIMILLDATVVNVALPSAQNDLGFSDATRQWVITAYVLAFGSLLPLGGRLGDVFGRKRLFLIGLVGFAAASALGGAAPNIGALIIARAAQGGFAAVLAPAALSLIAVTFTDLRELNKAFAIFGAVAGSAGAIGLLLGGVLTEYLSWRWCMYVNIPLAALGHRRRPVVAHQHERLEQAPVCRFPAPSSAQPRCSGIVFGSAQGRDRRLERRDHPHLTHRGSPAARRLRGPAEVRVLPTHPAPRARRPQPRRRAYLVLALSNFSLFAVFLFLTYYFQGVLGLHPGQNRAGVPAATG